MSNLTARHIEECRTLTNKPGNLTESERLNRLFELEWDYQMIENPVMATFNGYPGHNDRWPDLSLSEILRRKQDLTVWRDCLKSVDRGQLDDRDRMSYDIFGQYLDDEIEGAVFPDEFMAITQMHGPHQDIAAVMNIMPLFTTKDCHDILARLKGISELIEQNTELLSEGLRQGVTPPRSILGDVGQQILNQIPPEADNAPILEILKRIPESIPQSEASSLRAEAKACYSDQIVPALKKLHEYFTSTYLPACRESIACADLPNGKKWYEHLVRSFTTTDLSPEEVFQTGESEVARIRREMDEVIKSSGFKGSFEEFTEFLRTDPQFYHDNADDLVREYREISKKADPELARLFGTLPSLPYGVIVIPSYAEKSQTTAYYQPGSMEAGRPGYYYVNTYNLNSRPRWEMEPLTLHEAVPGHHLQISLAQELEGLPEFRKNAWITAYGEGWALYAESLGKEMGFYTSPYSRFGQLTYEMWRAVRLVVDVGMHYKGWDRQQAINFVLENSGKTEHDVAVEIDRYIVWPGQALAYKIGELKIKELRKFAEKSLGDDMSLRDFHDQILCHGSMPLSILDEHIRSWVAGRVKQ